MIARKQPLLVGSWLLLVLLSVSVIAQDGEPSPAEAEAHDQLRALRDKAVAAFQERDIDKLLECLADDVVVVVQNGELFQGHEGVREFHEAMSEGDNRKVQSQKSDFKVDDLSTFYGDDMATAHGTIDDHFVLTNGTEFDLSSRWSATMVKQDEKWEVATLHVSTNMFDNGVMDQLIWWNSIKVGAIALLVGMVVSFILLKLFGKRAATDDDA